MQNLIERQREAPDFVCGYVCEHGVAPSRPEVASGLGLAHKSAVDSHLRALMVKGFVGLQSGSPRNIRLLQGDLLVTVAGPIAAGKPVLAEGCITAWVPIAVAEMFSSRPDYFAIVEGDFMNRLDLTTGTIVAIEARPDPQDKDVVVAPGRTIWSRNSRVPRRNGTTGHRSRGSQERKNAKPCCAARRQDESPWRRVPALQEATSCRR